MFFVLYNVLKDINLEELILVFREHEGISLLTKVKSIKRCKY